MKIFLIVLLSLNVGMDIVDYTNYYAVGILKESPFLDWYNWHFINICTVIFLILIIKSTKVE